MRRAARPMRRSYVLVFVVMLAYICVLNFLVAHVMYLRYVGRRGAAPSSRGTPAAANRTPAAANSSAAAPRAVGSNVRPAACAPHNPHTDIAVRVTRIETATSNEASLAPVVRLLADLRARLLVAASDPVRVWLVVCPEDFVSLYRLWCAALVKDSEGRCSCEVLFATREQHAAIAWLVLRREACAARLYLLDEGFALPRRLLARSTGQPPAHVLRLDTGAERGRESLFLPACFLRRCVLAVCGPGTQPQIDAEIPAIAADPGRHACAA